MLEINFFNENFNRFFMFFDKVIFIFFIDYIYLVGIYLVFIIGYIF